MGWTFVRMLTKCLVFCYQNCSDLLWEKNVPVIEKVLFVAGNWFKFKQGLPFCQHPDKRSALLVLSGLYNKLWYLFQASCHQICGEIIYKPTWLVVKVSHWKGKVVMKKQNIDIFYFPTLLIGLDRSWMLFQTSICDLDIVTKIAWGSNYNWDFKYLLNFFCFFAFFFPYLSL